MNAEVRAADEGELIVQRVIQRYPLEPGLWITLTPEVEGWRCAVTTSADHTDGTAENDSTTFGADALAHLLRYQQVPPVERFELVRHAPTPEASGERPLDTIGRRVVVGERVVVTFNRLIRDIPYTSPVTLAQLSAVNFLGAPNVHGLLVWTTPSGYEAPVAVITRYLPRTVDGRQTLLTLLRRGIETEAAETPSLAGRMGRITAALHVALATRSSVLAEPIRAARAGDLRTWHERVRDTIDRATLVAAQSSATSLAARRFLDSRARYEADTDVLARVAESRSLVMLQRVHGDLNVGRILRWAGGLTITGFGREPRYDADWLGPQPAARDVARLLQSLASVARVIDEESDETRCTSEWLPDARRRVLTAYRTEMTVANRPELLDERLIAAFEAEHAAREVIEEARATRENPAL
jgi:predicted trehalose synthase